MAQSIQNKPQNLLSNNSLILTESLNTFMKFVNFQSKRFILESLF